MSFFSHILQPPAYLKLPVFALDISDESFKYIQFKETPRGFRLDSFGTRSLSPGIIRSGVINDTAALAAILRAELAPKQFRYVALALPEEKGFVRTIHMPRMDPLEMREAISLQLEEYVPLPAGQTSFAYHILLDRHPDTMDVLIVAYPTQLISAYRNVVEQAGLALVSLEIESQAIARAVIPSTEERGAVLVIDIGLTRTSFMFSENGYTQLTSTNPLGGKTMHETIMKALQVNEQEAERLKKEHGLSLTTKGKPVRDALLPLMSSLQSEIQRRIEFWREEAYKDQPRNKTRKLSRIYLCGREANLIGLPLFLSSQLAVPATLANVWTRVAYDRGFVPEIEFRDALGYATSIGLALGVP